MKNDLVSIVITTYNRTEMLKRAMLSVVNQTYRNIEIIVSDDNSTEDTESVVKEVRSLSEIPIHYRRNSKNMGACFTRNEGIKIANGVFVTGLDDDDEFEPVRIKTLLENYSDNYSFVASNTKVITKTNSFNMFNNGNVVSIDDMMWENVIGTQVFVRKERILEIGGFDTSLTSAQDSDMWIRLINQYGNALRIKEPLYVLHTEHDQSRISTSKKKLNGLINYNNKYILLKNKSQLKYSNLKLKKYKDETISFKEIVSILLDINIVAFLIKKTLRRL